MTGRDRLRWACYAGMAALYVASVPWYREEQSELVLWLGIPDWAAVALLCYVGVALLNTVAWLFSDMPEDPEPAASGSKGDAGPRI